MRKGVIERYRDHLPVTDRTPVFSLGEGNTPLVKSRVVAQMVGCRSLYFKLEGCNPTGSFKDRGMVLAVAKAIEAGNTSIACASTGNTSASAAAYGAYCDLSTTILVPKGNVARGKLAQAVAYGARVIIVNGNFDSAFEAVRVLTEKHPMVLVNSVNSDRLHGQKTAAFEIIEDLGDSPDYLFIPVGNAGNITAYWMGFTEAATAGLASHCPRMMGFEAEGAAPIVLGRPVDAPETVASAIRVGNPASWRSAIRARDESNGVIDAVSDNEIMEAYAILSRKEGVFGEPSSASSVAGLIKAANGGLDLEDRIVVCVITGTGLKDPDSARKLGDLPMEEHSPELAVLERALNLA